MLTSHGGVGKTMFMLNKKNDIIIYGCGELGINIAKLLKQNAFHILYLIDKNAEHIDIDINIPVIKLEELICNDSQNIVCIITCNNGNVHEEVAEKLFSIYGINKILYLPMNEKLSQGKKRLLRNAYRDLECGELNDIKCLPLYKMEQTQYEIIDDTHRGWVSFWIAVEQLFVPKASQIKKDFQGVFSLDKCLRYESKCVIEIESYVELFRFLKYGVGEVQVYLDEQRMHGRSDKQVIDDRKKLYQAYLLEFKHSDSFWVDSPSETIWDSELNKVVVIDGLHRIHFLISEGYKEVPVWMRRDDYLTMINA